MHFLLDAIKLKGWPLPLMILAFLFYLFSRYLFFASWFVIAQIGSIFGGGG